jgi:hypothetical protein
MGKGGLFSFSGRGLRRRREETNIDRFGWVPVPDYVHHWLLLPKSRAMRLELGTEG